VVNSVQKVQQKNEREYRFPPLLNFLKTEFNEGLKAENMQTVSSGLPNLDVALNGGWSPGLHVIAGTPQSGKRSLLVHMAEEFVKQEYAVIIITSKESPSSILQRIMARSTFKNNPSTAIPLSKISIHLSNNPLLLKQLTNQIAPTVKYLSVVQTDKLDFQSLEERLRHQKAVHDKSIILLDMHELSTWETDKEKLVGKFTSLQRIAKRLQIVMIATFDLNTIDHENLINGHLTVAGIERHVDTFIFLNSPAEKPANVSPNSPNNCLVSLQIQKNSIGQKNIVYLTKRTDFGYFQEG
jgi:KaiC/GvpD/RAD55 family RecA-like ATPase